MFAFGDLTNPLAVEEEKLGYSWGDQLLKKGMPFFPWNRSDRLAVLL